MRGPSLRIADVARRVGLTVGYCYALAAAGDLPPPHRERGCCLWYVADIAFWSKTRVDRRRKEWRNCKRHKSGARPRWARRRRRL